MSPLPRLGRRASALLGVSLALVMVIVAAFAAPALAQDANETTDEGNQTTEGGGAGTGGDATAGGNETTDGAGTGGSAPAGEARVLTIGVIDEGCPENSPGSPCWDTPFLVAPAGATVRVIADMRDSDVPHNLHITGVEGENLKTAVKPNEIHEVTFVMPASGLVEYVCDVHAETMIQPIRVPADAFSSGGGTVAINKLGVHFLAYWVGVIAFAVLFVVYGITFFLFKYNETPNTTDQWDRSGNDARDRKVLRDRALVLAFALAVLIGSAILLIKLTGNVNILEGQVAALQSELAQARASSGG